MTQANGYAAMEVGHRWIDDTVRNLESQGYQVVASAFPHRFRVLRRSKFLAVCRLHTFVVITTADRVNADQLAAFTADAVTYAKGEKGGLPLGLQTALAVFPVMVASEPTAEARALAERRPRKMWAAMPVPMLVEPAAGRVSTCGSSITYGKAFQDLLGKQQRLIAGSLSGPSMPRSYVGIVMTVLLTAVLVGMILLMLWPIAHMVLTGRPLP